MRAIEALLFNMPGRWGLTSARVMESLRRTCLKVCLDANSLAFSREVLMEPKSMEIPNFEHFFFEVQPYANKTNKNSCSNNSL